jgi:hypothetical protein
MLGLKNAAEPDGRSRQSQEQGRRRNARRLSLSAELRIVAVNLADAFEWAITLIRMCRP